MNNMERSRMREELYVWLHTFDDAELGHMLGEIKWKRNTIIQALLDYLSDSQLQTIYNDMLNTDPPEPEVRHGSQQIEDKTV